MKSRERVLQLEARDHEFCSADVRFTFPLMESRLRFSRFRDLALRVAIGSYEGQRREEERTYVHV